MWSPLDHNGLASESGSRGDHALSPEARRQNWKAMAMFTNVEEIQKFGKQQLEAASAATASLSKGLQEIAAEASDYSKKALAANTSVVEKLLGAKSVESAIQIQTDYAKTAYDGFVAQATKFNELYVKMATEAFKPVEASFSAVSKPVEAQA